VIGAEASATIPSRICWRGFGAEIHSPKTTDEGPCDHSDGQQNCKPACRVPRDPSRCVSCLAR